MFEVVAGADGDLAWSGMVGWWRRCKGVQGAQVGDTRQGRRRDGCMGVWDSTGAQHRQPTTDYYALSSKRHACLEFGLPRSVPEIIPSRGPNNFQAGVATRPVGCPDPGRTFDAIPWMVLEILGSIAPSPYLIHPVSIFLPHNSKTNLSLLILQTHH